MAGVAFWVLAAILIGFIGFWALATFLIVHVFRSMFTALRGPRDQAAPGLKSGASAVCPHQGCGHLNPRPGLYCSRCGRNLSKRREIDAYG